jgi:hypothetical protein
MGWRGFIPNINFNGLIAGLRQPRRDPRPYMQGWSGEDSDQFILPAPSVAGREELAASERRRKIYKLFLTVPGDIREMVGRFVARQWELLSLIVRCPEGAELIQSNASLAFALATLRIWRRPAPLQPWRTVRGLAMLRQREIAEWLGFPGTERTVRTLRKIPANVVTVPRLFYLRSALFDPDMSKALSHAPRLNAGVLRLVCDRDLMAHIRPTLIEEVACDLKNESLPQVAYDLRNALLFASLFSIKSKARLPRFDSIRKIHEFHAEIAVRVYEEIGVEPTQEVVPDLPKFTDVVLPPPPLHGNTNIQPLTTARDLITESIVQYNCVTSYAPTLAARQGAVYRVEWPQRATLLIGPDLATGLWKIKELKGWANSSVDSETREQVERWLALHNRPHAPWTEWHE